MGPDLVGLLALPALFAGVGTASSRSSNMELSPSSPSSSSLMSSSWAHLLPVVCFQETSPAIFLSSLSSTALPSSSMSAKLLAWIGLVRKLGLPPGYPGRGMEKGKAMAEPDAFGVDAVAGAEKVEARMMLAGSGPKPGGGAVETWKRDTPVTMLAGTEARGAPPKTGAVVVGTDLTPKPPVGRIPGRGGTLESATVGAIMGATST